MQLFKQHKIIRTCLIMLFAAISSFAMAQNAPVESPCDTNYYTSLKARAWMEAQREITQNQNLIFKPDSVLEYTCFDRFVGELADHAKDLFSETQRWGPVPGIRPTGPGSTDEALAALVGFPLQNYADENFWHDMLGGRSGSGLNYIFSLTELNYNCNIMDQVWMEAKCMDFIADTSNDGFYTFDEYASGSDKRFMPTVCPAGQTSQRWREEIKKATSNDDTDGTPWEEDLVSLFFEQINTLACASATPIRTGITVLRTGKDPKVFDEGVCIPSGCYAVPEVINNGNQVRLTCKRSV